VNIEDLLERAVVRDAHERGERAPARLKARIYSALINRLSETGPLLSLAATKAGGSGLCVFEEAWTRLPLGESVDATNLCRVCHARVLGERLDHAPIFWPHCPYSAFHHSKDD
jgi:hypothetical protein